MVVLKRFTAQLATGFMVTGALAGPTPLVLASDVSSQDIGASFVSELIVNATQLQHDQEGELEKRGLVNLICTQKSDRVVDLGYAKYQGSANSASGINSWKGSDALNLAPTRSHVLLTLLALPSTESDMLSPQPES